MGDVEKVIKSPNGLLKILTMALIIVDLGLARGGNDGNPIALPTNELWLVITCVCGYLVVVGFILFTYLRGGSLPLNVELMALLIGCILFIASGGVVTDTYQSGNNESGLALGILLIITGILMAVDSALLFKNS